MFKVEAYIEKCLLSCVSQDIPYTDYEIICVNDGSPDCSAQIAKRLSSRYPNISVIDQENQGLSVARNVGLEHAKGEYIWFVDSDDWIKKNILLELYEYASGNDILAINYTLAYDDSAKNKNVCYSFDGSFDGKSFFIKGRHTQAQFYICRRDYLIENKLSFFPGIYHEDTEYNHRLLYFAKKVTVFKTPVYYFYKRSNSISTTFNSKRLYDLLVILNKMREFRDNVVTDMKFKKYMDYNISMAYNSLLTYSLKAPRTIQIDIDRHLKFMPFIVKSLLKSPSYAHKVEGVFMMLFNKSQIETYKFLKLKFK